MKKSENKTCFILHSITAFLFTLTGILRITTEGWKEMMGISNLCLGITFASLAYTYYKKYKDEKKQTK